MFGNLQPPMQSNCIAYLPTTPAPRAFPFLAKEGSFKRLFRELELSHEVNTSPLL
jgi:hypothetical protein